MRTLARSALGDERVGGIAQHDARGVDEHGLAVTACKGEDEHQRIVQSERAHGPVTVEGTLALRELLVGDEQTAVAVPDVADGILVASVGQLIDHGVTVASVKCPDQGLLLGRLQTVVNGQLEEVVIVFIIGSLERGERGQQPHAVLLGILKR